MNLPDFKIELDDSGRDYYNRILIGTATTGLVRMEWVVSRYGQLVPVNWTSVNFTEPLSGYVPLRYLVADAQNVITQVAIEREFEWVLFWEHDTFPEGFDALMKINDYIVKCDIPVVSGLYYTKSVPSMPLIFRGRGTGPYINWKLGDLVWCDGVPTGFLLVHCSILKAMWEDSEEYILRNRVVRRVFVTPRTYQVVEKGEMNTVSGTSDLDWCSRVIDGGYFKKAGWKRFHNKKYPFLVDTNIFCKHIQPDGERFP